MSVFILPSAPNSGCVQCTLIPLLPPNSAVGGWPAPNLLPDHGSTEQCCRQGCEPSTAPSLTKTHENFPVSTEIVQRRGCTKEEKAQVRSESSTRVMLWEQKGEPGHSFRLSIFFPRKPRDKRGKPAIFLCLRFVIEATVIFISSVHSGSKSPFFFPLPNYNFSRRRTRKNSVKKHGAISVQTGMDNHQTAQWYPYGAFICPKGATKPQAKGKKGL